MIADLHLADPTRCPSCAGTLTAERDRCPACGLRLTGPLAGRLWQLSLEAQRLLDARSGLIEEMRRQEAPVAADRGPAGADRGPAGPPPEPATAAPRPEWSRHRVQNLLLALGVGLLGVAAIIFVAVSWDRLGVGGRSAVMAGVTALAGWAAVGAHRRGLLSTAEWLSLLTVGLAVVDCAGARAADLAGLAGTDGFAYWSGALVLVALLAALFAAVLPTRTLPVSAAVLGQLSGPLLAAQLADTRGHPLALVAVTMTAQTLAALTLALQWPFPDRTRAARVAVGVGGVVALAVASLTAAGAAYGEDGSLVVGTALLLLLGGAVAAAGTLLAGRPQADPAVLPVSTVLPLLDGFAALLVVAAVWAPAYDVVDEHWLAPVLGALGVALLAATMLVPAARRTAPALVALGAGVLPGRAAAEAVSSTVEGALEPLRGAWTQRVSEVAVVADRPAVLVLLVAGAALLLGGRVLAERRLGVVGVPVLVTAVAIAAPALGAGLAVTLAVWVLVGGALLVAGALVVAGVAPHGGHRVLAGWVVLGSGAALLALATVWSLAADVATLVTFPAAAAALLAGAAAARRVAALRPWRVVLVTTSVLLGVAEAGALARYGGAGWPAVWSLALSLLTGAAVVTALLLARRTAVTDVFWAPLHTAAVVVAAAALPADAAALARWAGSAWAGCGLAAVTAAAAVAMLTALPLTAVLPRTARPVRGTVQVVSGLVVVPALAVAALDGDRLWLALLAAGLGVAVVASTPERHACGWPAGLLLAASSWVRLALADVQAPEAYTVPAGVALVVVGALRRRRDPAYGSWAAYGAGLSLALVPSLLRAVTDAGNLRPLLLAVVAAGVVAVGAWRRLQAPLLIGALVLAVDALVQLAPYLAAAYDVVPRWVTIGAIGLLLVVAGATYEQRVRDLRKVGRHVAQMR